jgi:hypothetical protein
LYKKIDIFGTIEALKGYKQLSMLLKEMQASPEIKN